MKQKLLLVLCFTVLLSACSKDEFSSINSNAKEEAPPQVEVVDGHLRFVSQMSFNDYINQVKAQTEGGTSTRAYSGGTKIAGFTPLYQTINYQRLTRSVSDENIEELDFDPSLMIKADSLLPDELLYHVIDSTFTLEIANNYYRITEFGTFVTQREFSSQLDDIILDFNKNNLTKIGEDEYRVTGNVTILDTYGFISGNKTISSDVIQTEEYIDSEAITRSMNLSTNTSTYGLSTYAWEHKTWIGNLISKLFGKDVTRTNDFDSNNRVSAELFEVNYGFYASTGFKVKMQKRKKFLFVKYWVSQTAEDMVIGIEELEGQLTFNSLPNSVFDKSYATFQSTVQGVTNNMIYTGLGSPKFLEDWSNSVINVVAGALNVDFNTWKIDPYKYTQNLTKKQIFDGLNSLTNKYIYQPLKKQVTSKDPRVAYLFQGQGAKEAKSYVYGIQEYGCTDSKTIRFSQAGGFTISFGGTNKPSVGGYIPFQYKIKSVNIFGAAKFNGRWRGVRFTTY